MAWHSTVSAPAPRAGTWWGHREVAVRRALMATLVRRVGRGKGNRCSHRRLLS